MDPRHATCTSNTKIAGREFVLTMVLDQCGPQNAVRSSRQYFMWQTWWNTFPIDESNWFARSAETLRISSNICTKKTEPKRFMWKIKTHLPERFNSSESAHWLGRCFPNEHVSGRMALDTSDVRAIYCPKSPLVTREATRGVSVRTIPIWWYLLVVGHRCFPEMFDEKISGRKPL